MHEETDGCLLLVSSKFLKKSAIGSDRAVSFLSGAEGKCDRLLSLLGLNVSSALNSCKKKKSSNSSLFRGKIYRILCSHFGTLLQSSLHSVCETPQLCSSKVLTVPVSPSSKLNLGLRAHGEKNKGHWRGMQVSISISLRRARAATTIQEHSFRQRRHATDNRGFFFTPPSLSYYRSPPPPATLQ